MRARVWKDKLIVNTIAEGPFAGKWVTNGHLMIRCPLVDRLKGCENLSRLAVGKKYGGSDWIDDDLPDLTMITRLVEDKEKGRLLREVRGVLYGHHKTIVLATADAPHWCTTVDAEYADVVRMGETRAVDAKSPVGVWGPSLCAVVMPIRFDDGQLTWDGARLTVVPS